MNSAYLTAPLEFLLRTAFDLYILAFLLRFLFALSRADFRNPVAEFLVRITNPLLRPARRLMPGVGGVDIAAIVIMLALQVVAFLLVAALVGARLPGFGGILFLAVAELLKLTIYVYFFSILIEAILSWVSPGYSPVRALLADLNRPLLAPLRRLIPTVSGLDLSPLAALLLLQVVRIVLELALQDLARWLS